jgi:hypothetical protein
VIARTREVRPADDMFCSSCASASIYVTQHRREGGAGRSGGMEEGMEEQDREQGLQRKGEESGAPHLSSSSAS